MQESPLVTTFWRCTIAFIIIIIITSSYCYAMLSTTSANYSILTLMKSQAISSFLEHHRPSTKLSVIHCRLSCTLIVVDFVCRTTNLLTVALMATAFRLFGGEKLQSLSISNSQAYVVASRLLCHSDRQSQLLSAI